ncbi:tRNA pseudouridine(55) synthase TruB [Clostridium perfringens]|jgi:tRNA pseudouridine55 synthase|uniref:tRNA pseudouridine synthase B n=3 Tax=Clostridium perfringens TaxID=1502 RepID=TRUB_CLOP1|nr:tRNA pseudouridine(55) synthase TruB [Clostridium perfringens]Q0TPS0.1 RecName: Full=tRNA pseudouridine synthase B; AltName: Full=tRNA pseudouridine(55) synthase; Short=Psi55 synthase; AltName: Full=tRNA pseudouridylate synthase; AltName: Full=tRNA-uridine isomerase [Clostridium perfringens ATCC 13124]ABG83260.1 tRNA pseudouridine synthase B [Clostridium perfringens ATCC 13124]AMN33194.1 tRNA pseudouridine synthase B [Clostridium perfringens]AQW27246.1 tRNA pseudouridine(55) synthase TruB [C
MNGVINIYKNTGMTSFDVVAIVRRVAKMKKVGHTGTLDPAASGVLPVCLGKATKIIDYIMENKKVYRVNLKLGMVTDTYDLEGEVLREEDASHITKDEILNCINSFLGTIDQVPPMYSALKQNGVRLYELARQGIEVHREARKITIYSIENIKIESNDNIQMDVCCSKGTYIRSLCYDIGEKLNVGATMTALERIQNGTFTKEEAINIEDLTEELLEKHIISIEKALDSFEKITVNEKFGKLLRNGVKVFDNRMYSEEVEFNKLYRVYEDNGVFLGLGKRDEKGFKLEKLLIEE